VIKMAKCPVCKSELDGAVNQYNGTLIEEFQDCPECSYEYDFVYGAERYRVDGKTFVWPDVTDIPLEEQKEKDKAIAYARKNYNSNN
jgi:rubredoxin